MAKLYSSYYPKGSFGSGVEELRFRLELGIVEFTYKKDEDGSTRKARGTRNLLFEDVDVDAIPAGLRTPPEHVLTYYDLGKKEWRCFIKKNLIDFDSDIWFEEDE